VFSSFKHRSNTISVWLFIRDNNHSTFSLSLTQRPNKLVLHQPRLERLAGDKLSSLLGPFVSYEEKEFVSIQAPGWVLTTRLKRYFYNFCHNLSFLRNFVIKKYSKKDLS
jgi:hypothetical protein